MFFWPLFIIITTIGLWFKAETAPRFVLKVANGVIVLALAFLAFAMALSMNTTG